MTARELLHALPDLGTQGFMTHPEILGMLIDVGILGEDEQIERDWIDWIVQIPDPRPIKMYMGREMYRILNEILRSYQ
jgi:hypothetical protein